MIYAVIGIPLMLLFLTNIGSLFARGFRCFYKHCCSCTNEETTDQTALSHHSHHPHHHLHDHYHVHHIAMNEVNQVNPNCGHVARQCNSTSATDPYRTLKPCYPTVTDCNAMPIGAQKEHYIGGGHIVTGDGTGLIEGETKLCSTLDYPDHQICGTLNRTGAHHSHLNPHSTLNSGDHHHHHHLHPVSPPVDYMALGSGGSVDHPHHNNNHNDNSNRKRVTVPITLCLLLITLYVIFGASLFYLWEGWNLWDGSYFCFLTLSTIGFGNLVPTNSVLSNSVGSHKSLSFTLCIYWVEWP